MNKLSKYNQCKFLIGFVSLFSMSLLSRAPFENNPQNCEMISVVKRRKKANWQE
ncbi:hypothetical protein [Mucilaginibacter pocheonensis]|uniref:Cyclic lactone autoinducer peptide n=1 Tax=Mucilaginibacter pocheonensis TaxID=398050 RepID=A0ABU1T7R3_9SPHI|nr:hypothetical protein [Mucilaginibacter pocheonensis]MDR6941424.1 hypothetical protein [Mucilaginibacter pocheonensis]